MPTTKPKHLRAVKVTLLNPHPIAGQNIKFVDVYSVLRGVECRHSLTPSYDYDVGDLREQAQQFLLACGWNPESFTSEINGFTFLCDSWGPNYKTF